MPTPEEAQLLTPPGAVPVVRVPRAIYESQGEPVEVQGTVAAADRRRVRYEVDMGEAR